MGLKIERKYIFDGLRMLFGFFSRELGVLLYEILTTLMDVIAIFGEPPFLFSLTTQTP